MNRSASVLGPVAGLSERGTGNEPSGPIKSGEFD
jgi:hypothetical protein